MREHKRTYRRIIAAVTASDFEALDALMATDLVDLNRIPGQRPGLPGFTEWMGATRQSFADLAGTVEQVRGNLVAGRVTWHGTQTGPLRDWRSRSGDL